MRPIQTDIDGKQTILACAHWRTFPPTSMLLGIDPERLRDEKRIPDPEYQRIKVWQRVCGKFQMDVEGCTQCPLVRMATYKNMLPVLMTMDGRLATPTIDLPTLESAPRYRGFTIRANKPSGVTIKDSQDA